MLQPKVDIKNVISFLEPEFVHQDDRGSLRQLFSKNWTQVNFNTSFAGSVRGGHHHKDNREGFFVISGKFNLKLKTEGGVLEFLMKQEDFFVVEKNISHSFEFTEDTLLIAFYDVGIIKESNIKKPQIDIYQDE